MIAGGTLSLALLYAPVLHRYSAPGWHRYVLASKDEGADELAIKRDFLSQCNGFEGFARTGSLLAAWIASGRRPLIADTSDGKPVDLVARHGLDLVWRHFVAHGVLQDGALTQGFYRTDLRILDHYSGPGSCHWGLRSLVLAFLHEPDSDFWRSSDQPLPVEQADFRLAYDKVGWIVSGRRRDGSVTIEIPGNAGNASPPLVPYEPWRPWLERVFWRPFRPTNANAEYNRPVYSSAAAIVSN